jgi:hypothetical protein
MTSARAPGIGNRKVFLSTNGSAGADGGGEAIPDYVRRVPGAGHGVASEVWEVAIAGLGAPIG